MWDDHDLIDGFGSRVQQFNSSGEEDGNWTAYRQELTRAFWELQACKNHSYSSRPEANFTISKSLNGITFHALDLRSERNAEIRRLLGDETKARLEKSVQEGDRLQFFVSPVTFFRMEEETEGKLGEFASFLWTNTRWIEKVWSALVGAVEKLVPLPKFIVDLDLLFKAFGWGVVFLFLYLSVHTVSEVSAALAPAVSLLSISLLALTFLWRPSRRDLHIQTSLSWMAFAAAVFFLGTVTYLLWGLEHPVKLTLQTMEASFANLHQHYDVLIGASLLFSLGYLAHLSKDAWRTTFRILTLPTAAFLFLLLLRQGIPPDELSWTHLVSGIAWSVSVIYLTVAFLEASGILNELAGLDDDVKDGWSSIQNEKEMEWFFSCLLNRSGEFSPFVLSGDIHTGGVSVLRASRGEKTLTIPQIVSSPITYDPMPDVVEQFTTSKSFRTRELKVRLEAYNLFYRSRRNFAIVETLGDSHKTVVVDFHFEDMKGRPIGMEFSDQSRI